MIRVLYFHHSSDLYGSDKVLLTLVKGLERRRVTPIVVLPSKGPLYDALVNENVQTHVLPLAILNRSKMTPGGLAGIAMDAMKSIWSIDRAFKDVNVDIVHSNTIAVLSGAIWAGLRRVPHVWHVHEMIVRPRFLRQLIATTVNALSYCVACNSEATSRHLRETNSSISCKSVVVRNCIEINPGSADSEVRRFREALDLCNDDVVVALVGRINRWKGQRQLVAAADILWDKGLRNIHYLLVGGPPAGQEVFRTRLSEAIERSPARQNIHLFDYIDNIQIVWDSCDIAVVPSTEPEPFGLVALEAMASSKPVIAFAHGGVTEIVEDTATGFLIRPMDVQDLSDKIALLASQPSLRTKMGANGRKRAVNEFSCSEFIRNFFMLYNRVASDRPVS